MHSLIARLQASRDCDLAGLRLARRLLYVVNHAFPLSSNGYATRTHGVAQALVGAGYEVIVATRPDSPSNLRQGAASGLPVSHLIDGVRYIHTPTPSQSGMSSEGYADVYMDAAKGQMRVFKPAAVMAASNWQNAFPVAVAARELGLPFFYEVRGFWEVSRAARDPAWAESDGFAADVANETAVACAADKVFTINRFMCDELVRRGVDRERVELVPNGVVSADLAGCDRAPTAVELGTQSRWVVGYIGSFNAYEGLEDLIEAAAMLRRRGVDLAVLLVGSSTDAGGMASGTCAQSAAYRSLADRLGMRDHLILPGRVDAQQVADYYRLLDVVVIPRRPLAVSELVSPMKPLEAAAHGKRVLLSTVGPLADLAETCPNFHYFEKGRIDALADALAALLGEAEQGIGPRPCPGLADCTWDRNVAPIRRALDEVSVGCRSLARRT